MLWAIYLIPYVYQMNSIINETTTIFKKNPKDYYDII